MTSHGFSPTEVLVPRSAFYRGPYGRMFRNLRPMDPPVGESVEEYCRALSSRMVAEDSGQDNERIPAGYTYFGQFVDHDITFDPTSDLQRQNDPDRIRNFRTPRFDLDCLFGAGPFGMPYLYDREEPSKLLIGQGEGTIEDDLPRNQEGRALIGDPRNDENTIISQIQLGFIKLFNRTVDVVKEEMGLGEVSGKSMSSRLLEDIFRESQRLVRWHYQWVVVHDFLKRLVGGPLVDDLLAREKGELFVWQSDCFIPVEFSAAAYRVGHSMVRDSYFLNDKLTAKMAGFETKRPIPLFLAGDVAPRADLRGGKKLPEEWTLQWNLFLAVEGTTSTTGLQPSKRIDRQLARSLSALPGFPPVENSLAFRNLVRGFRMGLPSGQQVARAMGINPLPEEQDGPEPLWYYILREAESNDGAASGGVLGPVGGRIVAEVLVGLLRGDPLSFYNVEPRWGPTFPHTGETFELADLLLFAGMPITAEDPPIQDF